MFIRPNQPDVFLNQSNDYFVFTQSFGRFSKKKVLDGQDFYDACSLYHFEI